MVEPDSLILAQLRKIDEKLALVVDDVVVFGERLAQAEGEHDFAIGKMTENFARAPFAGRGRAVGSFRA